MPIFQLNELQRFIKNFFFLAGSAALNALVSIGITSHLSNVLQVDGFGTYSFLATYITYFTLLTSLGTDLVAVRMISMDPAGHHRVLGALLPLKVLLSVATFLLVLIPAIAVPKLSSYGWVTVVFALPILVSPFNAVACVFEASRRMEFLSVLNLLMNILNYLLFRILVVNPDGLATIGWVLAGTSLLYTVLFNACHLRVFGRCPVHFDRDLWREFLRKGLVIGFVQIVLVFFHNLNILILAFWKGDHEIGLFSAGYRAMFMILQLFNICHGLMGPILFSAFRKDPTLFRDNFQKYFKFMLYISSGVTVLAFFHSEAYLSLFYDLSRYSGSVRCFEILVVSLFFITINSPLHVGLLAAHQEKKILYIATFQLCVNVLFNVLLIPGHGIDGSATATVLAEASGLCFYVWHFNRVTRIRYLRDVAHAALAAGTMGVFLHFARINPLAEAGAGIVIMIGAAWLSKGITTGEVIDLKRTLWSCPGTRETRSPE